MSLDTGNPKSKKAAKSKSPKSKGPERLKCSLLLTKENDLRLTVLASLKGYRDRSRLLNEILDEALRGVVVSLRGPLSEGQIVTGTSGAGEGTSGEAETEAA